MKLITFAVAVAAGPLLVGCSTLPDDSTMTAAKSTSTSSLGTPLQVGNNGQNSSGGQDSNSAGVSQAYSDILGRAVDAGSLQSYVAQLNAGTISISTIRAQLAMSAEALNFLRSKWLQYFNTTADDNSLNAWAGYLAGGTMTHAGIDQAFSTSQTFLAMTLNFARLTFVEILARNPDQGSIDAFRAQIKGGGSYAGFRQSIANSAEGANRISAVFGMAYARGPNSSELSYWQTQLGNGLAMSSAQTQMLQAAAFAAIYPGTQTYVAQSYIQLFNRAPDGGGLAGYANAVQNGSLTYATMRQFLVTSPEATNQINSIYQQLFGRIANASEFSSQQAYLNGGGSVIAMQEGLLKGATCHGTPSCTGGQ